jgi:hypothetical protein
MSDYTPDRWTVIRIHTPGEVIYKVFASWSAGYAGSDSWKLNSGIVRATFADPYWEFDGIIGIGVLLPPGQYGTNGYGGHVLSNLIDKAEKQGMQIDVLGGETDWARLQYEPLAQWVESGVKMFKWLRYSGASVTITVNPHTGVGATGTPSSFKTNGWAQHEQAWFVGWLFLTIRIWVDDGSW